MNIIRENENSRKKKLNKSLTFVCIFCYNRLQSINENIKIKQEPRRRSNSLPIPKIEVSFHHEPDFRGKIVKPNCVNIFDAGDNSPGMFISKPIVIKLSLYQ